MQQNNSSRLCCDIDITINRKSECINLAQKKYENRYDFVGKVISRELCKIYLTIRTNSLSYNPGG